LESREAHEIIALNHKRPVDHPMNDLVLAIVHHLLVFSLAAVLAFEVAAVRPGMTRDALVGITQVDRWYGILAAAILVVGFARAIYAAKGWAYYSANVFFHAKLGTFLVVGLLSIVPTLAFIRWRKASRENPAFSPGEPEVRKVRIFLAAEVALFALIPAFAAAMARGYGER
jgi:putative membrane protein